MERDQPRIQNQVSILERLLGFLDHRDKSTTDVKIIFSKMQYFLRHLFMLALKLCLDALK